MSRVVIDASVAVKWFLPEIHSDIALRLIDPAYELLAPDLLYAEFGNVLWTRARRKDLTDAEAGDIIKTFRAIKLEAHPTADLLETAFAIGRVLDRTVYDAFYLALAVARSCRMVTADRKFYDAAARSPFASNVSWIVELH